MRFLTNYPTPMPYSPDSAIPRIARHVEERESSEGSRRQTRNPKLRGDVLAEKRRARVLPVAIEAYPNLRHQRRREVVEVAEPRHRPGSTLRVEERVDRAGRSDERPV